MSIHFVTGVPRSGKTYRSTYKIWQMYTLLELNNFKNLPSFMHWFFYYWYKFFPPAIKEVFTYTYTNINQFDFDYVGSEYYRPLRPLIYNDLYKKLRQLYLLKDKGDDVLTAKAKDLEIYHSLFVWDECHNNLGTKKEDEVIEWWLTYHGHLHQEIHLITQQMKLINAKYKGIAEYFYKAYASSKQVSKNNFRYSLHQCAGYYAKEAKTKIFVPFKEEVFKLYVSGKAQKRVNIMARFYLLIPFGLFILMSGFFFFSSIFASESVIVDKNSSISPCESVLKIPIDSNTSKDVSSELVTIEFDKELLIVFKCVDANCYYETVTLPISFLEFYIKAYPPKYYDIASHGLHYSTYTMLVTKELSTLLIPEKQSKKEKEKDAKNHNPINSVFKPTR